MDVNEKDFDERLDRSESEQDGDIGAQNLPLEEEEEEEAQEPEEDESLAEEFKFEVINLKEETTKDEKFETKDEKLKIKDVVSFIQNYIKPIEFPLKDSDERIAFRGVAADSYELEPSIFRDEFAQNEAYLYHELERYVPEELNKFDDLFDKLCKMQHYSLPTRLLDLTTNPLVALYFACHSNEDEKEKDGKVVAMQGRFYYSNEPTIQWISAFANYYRSNPRKIYTVEGFIQYLNKKGFHDISGENIIEALKLRWVGVMPNYSNARLKAQQGLFLLFGLGKGLDIGDKFEKNEENEKNEKSYVPIIEKEIEEEKRKKAEEKRKKSEGSEKKEKEPDRKKADKVFYHCYIPYAYKKSILEELEHLGIHQASLMPEMESISKYIKNKYIISGTGKTTIM